MRKLFGAILLLAAVGGYLHYVQGWDWARLKRTRAVALVLREDASATTTPIGARGTGTHWETAAPMPGARTEFGAVTVGDRIYAIGGIDGYMRTLDAVQSYDVVSDTWRDEPKLPMPIHHPAVATDGANVYVLGGFTGLASRPLDSAYAYDPKTRSWREIGRLNDFRGGAAAAFLGDRLYVMAGRTGGGVDGALEYYDAARGGWNGLKGLSVPRTLFQAAALDGKLYAIGGNRGSVSTSLSDVESYDPVANEWKGVGAMSAARSGFASVVVDGSVYAIGGEGKAGVLGLVEAFDPKKGVWSKLSPGLPDPRRGLAAAAWKNRIYVLGGGRRSGLSVTDLNSVLILDGSAAKKR